MKQIALILSLLLASPAWAAEFGYHPVSAPGTPLLMDGGFGFVNTGDATAALRHTAGAGETIDSLYVWIYSDNVSTDDVNLKVYTIVPSDSVDARVLVATVVDVGTGPPLTIKGVDVNFAMTNGVTYCVGIDTANTVAMVCGYDAGGTNDAESKTTPLPDPYGARGTNQARKYGVWAVYTTSGGGSTSLPIGGNVVIGGNTAIGGK